MLAFYDIQQKTFTVYHTIVQYNLSSIRYLTNYFMYLINIIEYLQKLSQIYLNLPKL